MRKGFGGKNWNATEIQFYNKYLKKTNIGRDAEDYVLKPNQYGVLESVPTFVSKDDDCIELKTEDDLFAIWDKMDKQEEVYEMEIEEAGKIWRDMVPCDGLEDVEHKLKKKIKTI